MSMKKMVFLLCLFSLNFGFAQNETLFDEATELYNNGEYSKAIENYKQILENGQHSASLYFNLGISITRSHTATRRPSHVISGSTMRNLPRGLAPLAARSLAP